MKHRRPQAPKTWKSKKYQEPSEKRIKKVDKDKKPKYKYIVDVEAT